MATKRPGGKSSSPSPSSGSGSGSNGSGKSAQLAAILEQIEEVEIQIAQTRLDDKNNELTHKQNVNGKKDEIRQVTERTWDTKVEVANAGLQIGESKVDLSQDRVGVQQQITSLEKTLGEERVSKVRRKIYQIHEFDEVPE